MWVSRSDAYEGESSEKLKLCYLLFDLQVSMIQAADVGELLPPLFLLR
jgi:hypothetical protein